VKDFADLYAELDASTSTLHKVDALERYFRAAPPGDAAWAVYFLAGGKPRQAVPSRVLREAARAAAGLPEWLFEESYQAVGDLAETIAHLLPPGGEGTPESLAAWMTGRILPLRGAPPEQATRALQAMWAGLDWNGRFVLNKLITGGLRVGVSRLLVVRALGRAAGLDEKLVAQRMMGYTDAGRAPDAARWHALVAPADADRACGSVAGDPYPFFLAHPLQQPPEGLGDPADWLVEWKWDGIRAQLVLRGGRAWLWSRGEELVTERFPEIERAGLDWARAVAPSGAGVVLDGEVLAWDAARDAPMPFAALQRRVTRRTLGAALLREVPAAFVAYDLLEWAGEDWRARPLAERRARLESLIPVPGQAQTPGAPRLSPRVSGADWRALAALRDASRERGVEGFMLKRLASAYGVGRTRADGADWWKWKVDPYTVDAVLVYAQRGHGRRANLYTDYTFAVWDRPASDVEADADAPRRLLPFAKAYSGLTDDEIRQVDAIVRRTTVEKFGPVRSVVPTLVFELGFEGIARSPRHKSGLAVRFPRMLRWRTDKTPGQADAIDVLRAMLDGAARGG
jgi:DNA ligase-1